MTKGIGESKDMYGLKKGKINKICTSNYLCPYHTKRKLFDPIIPEGAPFERYEDYNGALTIAKSQKRELIGGWYIWKPHFDLLLQSLQRVSNSGDTQSIKVLNIGMASGVAFEGLLKTINFFRCNEKTAVAIDTCDPCVAPLIEIARRFPNQFSIENNLFAEPIETLADSKPNLYNLALVHYTLSFISGIDKKRQFLQATKSILAENGKALVVFSVNDKDLKSRGTFTKIAKEVGFGKIIIGSTTDPFDGSGLGVGKNFVATLYN